MLPDYLCYSDYFQSLHIYYYYEQKERKPLTLLLQERIGGHYENYVRKQYP